MYGFCVDLQVNGSQGYIYNRIYGKILCMCAWAISEKSIIAYTSNLGHTETPPQQKTPTQTPPVWRSASSASECTRKRMERGGVGWVLHRGSSALNNTPTRQRRHTPSGRFVDNTMCNITITVLMYEDVQFTQRVWPIATHNNTVLHTLT